MGVCKLDEYCGTLIADYQNIVRNTLRISHSVGFYTSNEALIRITDFFGIRKQCPKQNKVRIPVIPLFPRVLVESLVVNHIRQRIELIKRNFCADAVDANSGELVGYQEAARKLEALEDSLPDATVNKWVLFAISLIIIGGLLYVTNLLTPFSTPERTAITGVLSSVPSLNVGDTLNALMDPNLPSAVQKMVLPLLFSSYSLFAFVYYFSVKRWLFNYPDKGYSCDCTITELYNQGMSQRSGAYVHEKQAFQVLGLSEPAEFQLDLASLGLFVILITTYVYYLVLNASMKSLAAYRGLGSLYIVIGSATVLLCAWWWITRRTQKNMAIDIARLEQEIFQQFKAKAYFKQTPEQSVIGGLANVIVILLIGFFAISLPISAILLSSTALYGSGVIDASASVFNVSRETFSQAIHGYGAIVALLVLTFLTASLGSRLTSRVNTINIRQVLTNNYWRLRWLPAGTRYTVDIKWDSGEYDDNYQTSIERFAAALCGKQAEFTGAAILLPKLPIRCITASIVTSNGDLVKKVAAIPCSKRKKNETCQGS